MRILMIDDHPLVLDALGAIVTMLAGIEGADRVATIGQALQMIAARPPYALHVVDMTLPDARDTQGIEQLRMMKPEVPVAVFTGNEDPMMVSAAFEAGARGYILKSAPADRILTGLRRVLNGGTYVPDELIDRLMATVDSLRAKTSGPIQDPDDLLADMGLTHRQIDVLRLINKGMPNKLICRELNMAEGTVKSHLNQIYQQLGVHNRLQAILKIQAMTGAGL